MDVSSVSETVLSRLKDAYDYAGMVYHTDPLAASGLRRHRMRRFVSAQISESLEELPGEIRAVLLNGNDRRFFALLQEASDEIKQRAKGLGTNLLFARNRAGMRWGCCCGRRSGRRLRRIPERSAFCSTIRSHIAEY